MTELDKTTLETMIHLLDGKATAGDWRRLLALLQPTGVADMLQIQEALQLPRDRARRLMEQMRSCSAGNPAILQPTHFSTQRAGVRGRTPTIYRLGKSGAAILRTLGDKDSRECQLKTETEIQHAVLMLDVRLAALKANLEVVTDQEIPYGENRSLRPDNAIRLSDSTLILYETEQAASSSNMRRITSSLANKQAFFKSKEGSGVSPVIRMLVNVAQGTEWERTIKVWKQVARIVAQGKAIPFKLLAMPHTAFLDDPDWGAQPAVERWVDLTPVPEAEQEKTSESTALAVRPPQRLLRQSAAEDRLVLTALWQQFLENGQPVPDAAPRPSPTFFDTMQLIHSASFNPNADALTRASMPWASIFLLREYLRMHPGLKKQLALSILRAAQAMRWNTTNILHRVQVVIDRFMAYHGWSNNGGLRFEAGTYDYTTDDDVGFSISVRIREPELLMEPWQTIVPSREKLKEAEEALAWVLWALFAYADRLDLPTCGFW